MLDWKRSVSSALSGAGLDPVRESEIVEEFSQHLQDRYDELIRSGAPPQEAERAVEDELRGGQLASRLRWAIVSSRDRAPLEVTSGESITASLLQDLRFGLRLLRLSPGFTVVAVLSLALGIGANTAIFQLIDTVRLRLLPVKDPEQLANIQIKPTDDGRTGNFRSRAPNLTNALFQQIRQQQQGFSDVAAWGSATFNMNAGGEARYARGMWVSGTFFEVLGVQPFAGRLLSAADDQTGCSSPAIVISYSFWQREFGGRDSAVGSTLTLERRPMQIVGVAPPRFFGTEVGHNFDVAVPMCAEPLVDTEEPAVTTPDTWWLAAIGRLKPGWTVERATAQLASVSPAVFEATQPPKYDAVDRNSYLHFQLETRSAASGLSDIRKQYEEPLWLLMGISALVLLIACANLANLMLARATARGREMAVRLALGASRSRLVRQLLAENVLLSILGAVLGIVVSQVLSRTLVSFLTTTRTLIFLDLHIDWTVLGFTATLAIFTCLVFGTAPAVQASRTMPAEAMKANSRGLTDGSKRFRLRRVLVIAQVALSLVLLASALLFVGTFRNLATQKIGINQEHILVAEVDYSSMNLPRDRRIAYNREILDQVRAIPGVESAANAFIVPVSGSGWNDNISIDGVANKRLVANFNRVTPGYFTTMGTALLAGRDFSEQDTTGSPLVAVVTQTFSKKFLDGANPIGRRITLPQPNGNPDRVYEIVGLVADSKYLKLRDEFSPIVFVAEAQAERPDPFAEVMIRTVNSPEDMLPSVRAALIRFNPDAVLRFTVFKEFVREALVRERIMAMLAGFFGVLAASLATIGLYGVISYMVVRRRNEIGIRMALGANPRAIVSMVLREAASLLGIGIATGIALTLVAAPAARALLYGLQPHDPLMLLSATLLLGIVALVASFFPAARAARVDAMLALREE